MNKIMFRQPLLPFSTPGVVGRGADLKAATFLGEGAAPKLVNKYPCHSISVRPSKVFSGSNVNLLSLNAFKAIAL